MTLFYMCDNCYMIVKPPVHIYTSKYGFSHLCEKCHQEIMNSLREIHPILPRLRHMEQQE